MKMIKLHDGGEVSERELDAMCFPRDMLPFTPEERAEQKRIQNGVQNGTVTLREAAEFICEVVMPYRFAIIEEARAIDRAQMAQQCR